MQKRFVKEVRFDFRSDKIKPLRHSYQKFVNHDLSIGWIFSARHARGPTILEPRQIKGPTKVLCRLGETCVSDKKYNVDEWKINYCSLPSGYPRWQRSKVDW